MADEFKINMHSKCGSGGIYCDCCNPFHGGKKHRNCKQAKLRQLARRIMKQNDFKLFKEYSDD